MTAPPAVRSRWLYERNATYVICLLATCYGQSGNDSKSSASLWLKDSPAFTIRFWGLSYHPRGERINAFLMPRKLDSHAYSVLNLGAALHVEVPVWRNFLALRTTSALYADCANRLAGLLYAGLQPPILSYRKHSFQSTFGVAYVWRRSWRELAGYQDPGFFRTTPGGRFQYRWLPAGEVAYLYHVSAAVALSVGIIPGVPHVVHFSVGMRIVPERVFDKEGVKSL